MWLARWTSRPMPTQHGPHISSNEVKLPSVWRCCCFWYHLRSAVQYCFGFSKVSGGSVYCQRHEPSNAPGWARYIRRWDKISSADRLGQPYSAAIQESTCMFHKRWPGTIYCSNQRASRQLILRGAHTFDPWHLLKVIKSKFLEAVLFLKRGPRK